MLTSSSDATQTQIQSFELTHPSIYPINELLDCKKRLVPQIQICRVPTTQGKKRISRRSFSEVSVLIDSQKPEM